MQQSKQLMSTAVCRSPLCGEVAGLHSDCRVISRLGWTIADASRTGRSDRHATAGHLPSRLPGILGGRGFLSAATEPACHKYRAGINLSSLHLARAVGTKGSQPPDFGNNFGILWCTKMHYRSLQCIHTSARSTNRLSNVSSRVFLHDPSAAISSTARGPASTSHFTPRVRQRHR